MKIEISEDEAVRIAKALSQYSAFLHATNRDDRRYEAFAERIKKPPESETLPEPARRKRK